MAMCDAYLRFTLVDIGAAGRQSDGGVLKHSAMGQMLQANQLNVPVPAKVGNNGPILPFVVVADEAFPLTTYMMRPFPRRTILNNRKKLFNYRLSRARRLIESCFGILSSRWRIYRKPIIASESTIITIIQATTCLHNFLMNHENNLAKSNRQYSNINSNEDVTADALLTIGRTSSNTFSRNASAIREKFTDYFEGAGAVEWQWEKVLQNDF